MIIKERRSQVERRSESLEIGCLDDTVIVAVSQWQTVGQILEATVDGHMMVGADCCTENFVLPVCVGGS